MPNLHPYQRQDAAVMASRRGTILAYEAGGGKTAAAIAAGLKVAPRGPWWICTKRNALDQWAKELQAWAPGMTNLRLTHYEAAHMHQGEGIRASFVILDESDEARNADTDIFKTLYPICTARPKQKILATATPLRNGPADLVAQMVLAGVFSWEQYQEAIYYYCDPSLDGFNGKIDARGAANLASLADVLAGVLLRRTYLDFGFAMPTPVFSNLAADPWAGEDAEKYKKAAVDFGAWYRASRGQAAPPMAKFVTQRRLLELAKLPAAAVAVRADLAAGGHVLTFCEFRETAERLHAEFKGSGLIIGGDSAAGRADVVETLATAAGAHAVFATTGALDSALNMQTVDRVNYVSTGWDPSTFSQTAARAWRQGRRAPVYLRRFFWPDDELENYILDVNFRKENILKTLNLLPTLSMGRLAGS